MAVLFSNLKKAFSLHEVGVKSIIRHDMLIIFWFFAFMINILLSVTQNNTGEEDIIHYQCMYCDRIYLSENILDWHMSTQHPITGTLF